ncbi:RNA:NAD 2'-phosphotransferase TPT1 [Phaffia rhodozyma]|uniref:2'-phosphotransferase n=1 Tax=Phaffia rhodozyma TaxID=264483 RepID=A0A0F7SGS4_PHARH|nr:RNA:NAD 2'-phosphotransferase TPT1 [Phaffia rhodozyma]
MSVINQNPSPLSPPQNPKQTPRPKHTPKVRKPNQSKTLRGRPTDPPHTRLSKTLAYLLRHGAEKEGLGIRPDGYLPVNELIAHPALALNSVTFESIRQIVLDDVKTRYALIFAQDISSSAEATTLVPLEERDPMADEQDGRWWIRANQGHSLEMKELEKDMRIVTTVDQAGLAVHGTDEKLWNAIYEQGLSKMTRQHIHLALALPSQKSPSTISSEAGSNQESSDPGLGSGPVQKITSGIRPSANLYIYIDVPLLLSENVPLFLSDNNVLLTPGDPVTPGILPRKYFLRAIRKNGEIVWERPK